MKKIISLKLGVLVDLKRSKRLFFLSQPTYLSCCWIQVMSLMMIMKLMLLLMLQLRLMLLLLLIMLLMLMKTQGMMHQIKKQNQQYQKQVLLKRLQYLKLRRREDHEVLTKKKPNNSFFTLFFTHLLFYYVKTTFLFYQLLNS